MIFIYFMVTNFWMCARFFSFGPSPPSPPFPLHASWLMCLDIRISSTTAAVYLFECVSHVYLPFRMHTAMVVLWIIHLDLHHILCTLPLLLLIHTGTHTHCGSNVSSQSEREATRKLNKKKCALGMNNTKDAKQNQTNSFELNRFTTIMPRNNVDWRWQRERASGWTGERTMEQRRAKAPRTKG